MKFIGLTGGVGAGKTTVLKALAQMAQVRVLIADEIAHELMEPGNSCYRSLHEIFSMEDIWRSDGCIDRAALAKLLFSDEKKREQLNAIVHPAVKQFIINEVERERAIGERELVILEAALLIEEHYDAICDELWYVFASKETRERRLIEQRGYSKEKVEQIFAAQLSEEEYRAHCARVIDNDGDLTHVIEQLTQLLANKEK